MMIVVEKSVVCPLLVGRLPHLDAFDRLSEQVEAGKGQVVLFSGEAGIGKSRLVAEMSTRVERKGWLSLKGNCYESDGAFPHASLLDLLKSHFAGLTSSAIRNEVGPAANIFARL